MRKLLLTVALFMQGSLLAQGPQLLRLKDAIAEFPRSQLQLKSNGPISLQVDQGELAAYERIAEIAGLNIVFDPDFRNSSNGPFRIDNADVLQAFDILSARVGAFVEVLNSNTVIVSRDNQTKRRDYEQMVLKTFYLPNAASPQRLTEIITALRTNLGMRYLAQSTTANALLVRDDPHRVAEAEKIIGLSMPLVQGPSAAQISDYVGSGHILTLEGTAVRDSTPKRSRLEVSGRGPGSFDTKGSTRELFEMLSSAAGLNVIFDPDLRSIEQPFKVNTLDVLDAMDILALRTRTFWEPVDNKTIIVAPDNQTKLRDYENLSVKTFYIPNASRTEMTEIVTALRTLLNMRYLALVTDSNAIVMRDAANKLALAERIITDLRKVGGFTATAGFPSGSESGFVLNRRAAKTAGTLQSAVRGPLSFDANDSARATYEAVAGTAGFRVVFDNRFKDEAAVPFKVQNVEAADALDFLALQTRTIWQMMDRETILVAPDNQTVRADLLPKVTKTVDLPARFQSSTNISEFVTTLRTIFNIRQISTVGNSIVLTDTAENIAFSEKILADLESPPVR